MVRSAPEVAKASYTDDDTESSADFLKRRQGLRVLVGEFHYGKIYFITSRRFRVSLHVMTECFRSFFFWRFYKLRCLTLRYSRPFSKTHNGSDVLSEVIYAFLICMKNTKQYTFFYIINILTVHKLLFVCTTVVKVTKRYILAKLGTLFLRVNKGCIWKTEKRGKRYYLIKVLLVPQQYNWLSYSCISSCISRCRGSCSQKEMQNANIAYRIKNLFLRIVD